MKLASCIALLVLLLIAACSAGNASQNDKNRGFYSGVTGGGQR